MAVEALHETLGNAATTGFPAGTATNDPRLRARHGPKALGIDGFFDVVIGYNTARPNPYPDPLL